MKQAAGTHGGQDKNILATRHALYCQTKERHPRRWSGASRNWSVIEAVTLNPERDAVGKSAAASVQHNKLKAA